MQNVSAGASREADLDVLKVSTNPSSEHLETRLIFSAILS